MPRAVIDLNTESGLAVVKGQCKFGPRLLRGRATGC